MAVFLPITSVLMHILKFILTDIIFTKIVQKFVILKMFIKKILFK